MSKGVLFLGSFILIGVGLIGFYVEGDFAPFRPYAAAGHALMWMAIASK